ncbi:MAG: hypothetical protein WCJ51_04015 [Candidatus Moraniibacteriota bacterium]
MNKSDTNLSTNCTTYFVTEPKGLEENKLPAKKGGQIAKDARLALENKTGKKVVTGGNFLGGRKVLK